MLKRLISLNLALLMILSLLPIGTAQAVETDYSVTLWYKTEPGDTCEQLVQTIPSGSTYIYLTPPAPYSYGFTIENTRHVFLGWNTEEDGTGDAYPTYYKESDYDIPTELWAQYGETDAGYIHYDANGGTKDGEKTYIFTSIDFDNPAETDVYPNFDHTNANGDPFLCWSDNPYGPITVYFPGEKITQTADTTLYAYYGDRLIVYHHDDKTEASTFSYIDAPIVSDAHKNDLFLGWNTKEDGTGDWYAPNTFIDLLSGTVLHLYPQYETLDNEKVQIVYDANGGTAPNGANMLIVDAADVTTIHDGTGFTPNYSFNTFCGWSMQADGSGIPYAPESKVSLSQTITLYAQWDSFVTYYYCFDEDENLIWYVQEYPGMTAPDEGIIDGKLHLGYSTNQDGTGTFYNVGDPIYADYGYVLLYAQYQELPDEYAIVDFWYLNSETNLEKTAISLSEKLPTELEGIEITGYITEDNIFYPAGEGTSGILPGEKLYAIPVSNRDRNFRWINFENGNESVTKAFKVNATSGNLMLFEQDYDFTPAEGQKFDMWRQGQTTYDASATLSQVWDGTYEKPATLSAQWRANEGIEITYVHVEKGAIVKSYEPKQKALGANTFSDEDLHVIGWSLTPGLNPAELDYLPGEEIETDRDLTLYAVMGLGYTKLHYRVNVDTDQETLVVFRNLTTSLGSCGSDYGGYNDRYIFLGWNTKENGFGEWYTSYEDPEDYPPELYAQYQKAGQYYILLSCNEGMAEDNRQVLYIAADSADPMSVTLPTVTSKGNDILFYRSDDVVIEGTQAQLTPGRTYYAITSPDEGYYAKIVSPEKNKYLYVGYVSGGNLVSSSFATHEIYSESEKVHVGYTGEKTKTVYEFNDDVLTAARAEANDNRVATFTTVYEDISTPYIQYIGNGGSTSKDESYIVKEGLDGVYADNPFSAPDGKVFLGWVDNTGNITNRDNWYFPGESITHTQSSVLHAVWGKNIVILHYRDQVAVWVDGGSIFFNDNSTNEVFNGWNTKEDGTGEWILSGFNNFPIGTIVELYAQFVSEPEEPYYVLQNYAGKYTFGILTESPQTITLPSDNGVLGWYSGRLNASGWIGESSVLSPGTQVSVKDGDVYSAMSPDVPYMGFVEYHLNSTTDSVRTAYTYSSFANLEIYDAETVFGDEVPDKTFDGWNTNADGSGTSYQAGEKLTEHSLLKLFAQWRTVSPQRPTVPDSPSTPNMPSDPMIPSLPDKPNISETPSKPDTSDPSVPNDPDPTIEPENYFDDVSRDDWFYSDVAFVMKTGLMSGTDLGFEPELDTSRASVAMVLWNLANKPDAADAGFTDVTDGDWYANAVSWAAGVGIVAGYEGGNFGPNENITREQFAAILHRFAKTLDMDTSSDITLHLLFTDAAAISDYAISAMTWAVDVGLFRGIGDDRLNPQGTVTRAQLAAILHRFCEMMK